MTKIKIIGDPGKHDVEKIKEWLERAFEKFDLPLEKLYLIFIENIKQFELVARKYTNIFEVFTSSLALVILKFHYKIFYDASKISYIPKNSRKKKFPPIILIAKRGDWKIPQRSIFHEVAHLKEDEDGWKKIEDEALELLSEDFLGISEAFKSAISIWLNRKLSDFFANEIMCQKGLFNEVMEEKQEMLCHYFKDSLPLSVEKEWLKFLSAMIVAFGGALPPSYSRKEDEKKLEGIIITDIHEMAMEKEYREIKSIVSKLKSPPEINNIYKCGVEIIELAQEFLETPQKEFSSTG